jgi:hypothetical protein
MRERYSPNIEIVLFNLKGPWNEFFFTIAPPRPTLLLEPTAVSLDNRATILYFGGQ